MPSIFVCVLPPGVSLPCRRRIDDGGSEAWLNLITERPIRHGTPTAASALIGQARACIEHRNTRAEPSARAAVDDDAK